MTPGQRPLADERDRLIAAAWTVLARSGFEGFKVQLVLREAGVSARGFYGHFEGKAQLLLALMEEEMARSGALITAAVAREPTPEARVGAWARSILGAVRNPRRAPRARLFTNLVVVLREYPAEVAQAQMALTDPLRQAIEDGCADGTFASADVGRDTQAVYALVGSLMTSCLHDPVRFPIDEVTDAAVSFALRALKTGP